jgi:hypothetical protein
MSDVVMKTPPQYLDSAMGALRNLGLTQGKPEETPVIGLLQKISDLAPDKIAVITRTLAQMSVFNEVVPERISQMSMAQRYEQITQGFNKYHSVSDVAYTLLASVKQSQPG